MAFAVAIKAQGGDFEVAQRQLPQGRPVPRVACKCRASAQEGWSGPHVHRLQGPEQGKS